MAKLSTLLRDEAKRIGQLRPNLPIEAANEIDRVTAEIDRVTAERDKLRAACETFLAKKWGVSRSMGGFEYFSVENFVAAIIAECKADDD